MSEQIDNMSSELLFALDKIAFDFNRRVLQFLLEKGEVDITTLQDIGSNTHVSINGLQTRLANLEKAKLIEIMGTDEGRTRLGKVRLTTFGEVLIRSLLVAQKLLEAKS